MFKSIETVGIAALLLVGTAQADALRWDSTGHVVVAAKVNGRGPFDFILDTGADESAVYAWFARDLNLPKGKAGELSGAVGSEPMITSKIGTLEVAGRILANVEADTLPDRPDGVRLAGIAGVDLMIGRLTVIDFGCATLAFRPLSVPDTSLKGETRVDAGSIQGGKQLTFPVTLNGVIGVAVLDSGARQTIINRSFAAAADVDTNGPSFRDALPTRGATATTLASRVGTIGLVTFAGLTRAGVKARVLDLPFFKEAGWENRPAMDLGADLLRGTRLTIDYAARRFWLASSSCASSEAAD